MLALCQTYFLQAKRNVFIWQLIRVGKKSNSDDKLLV